MSAMPEAVMMPDVQPLPSGTHEVIPSDKGRVLLRNVEVYGEMADGGKLGKVDESKLRAIALATNGLMLRGKYPQVIVTHDKGAPVVGHIPTPLRVGQDGAGVWTIYADMEFGRGDFDCYVASNRFPRRSAEIQVDDLVMSQVSLLGRDEAAVVMPDVRFSKAESRGGVDIATGAKHDSTANNSATYVPTVVKVKENSMDSETIIDAIEALIDGMTDEQREKFSKKSRAALAKHNKGDDSPDKGKDDDMEKNAKPGATANADALATQVASLQTQLHRTQAEFAEYRKSSDDRAVELSWANRLESLRDHEGYHTVNIQHELNAMKAMPNETARLAHLDFIRANYARRPTAAGLVQHSSIAGVVTAQRSGAEKFGAADQQRIVDHSTRTGKTFDESAKELGIVLR